MNNTNQNIGILTLLSLKGIGQAFIKKHVVQDYFNGNTISEIKQVLLKGNKTFSENELNSTVDEAKETIENCEEFGITVMNQFETAYPKNILALRDSPAILFLKGNLNLLNNISVGLIGTRKPNSNGLRITERISAHYHEKNWNLCNGLAEGIDMASVINRGKCYDKVIGVLAGGLNFKDKKTLLKSTASNAERVLDAGGLLISEESLNKKEDTFTVVKSCRIQAGISNGLILVQSSIDGGSKYTLKSFAELGRPLAVINPLSGDYNEPSYEANKLIIEEKIKGIEKITELKTDKIKTKEIIVFSSKSDYMNFDSLISKGDSNNASQSLLF